MTNNAAYVLDTGVLVSAVLLPRSVPRHAVDAAFAHGLVLASVATLDELDDVLRRQKFDRYIHEAERLRFLAAYMRDVRAIAITESITDCRDPKDNKFLELGVSGNATCIVSGDRDLLDLHPYRGIAIVTPHDFLQHQ